MHLLYVISATGSPGLLAGLGIDWRTLILDSLGFLITVGILGKWVYPALIKTLDTKQAELESAAALEQQAKQELVKVQLMVAEIVSDAHKAAEEILATAKTEAAEFVSDSNAKATAHAKRIVSEAHIELDRDVSRARTMLKLETAHLVALATETVLGEKLNDSSDSRLIARSLEGRR